MKKLILSTAVIALLAIGTTANAQVSINVNIGQQPQWEPVRYNYTTYTPVRYYQKNSVRYNKVVPTHHYANNYKVVRRVYHPTNRYYTTNKHFEKYYKPKYYNERHDNGHGHKKGKH